MNIRQAEKVSQVSDAGKNSDSPFYSEIKTSKTKMKNDIILMKVMQVLIVTKFWILLIIKKIRNRYWICN